MWCSYTLPFFEPKSSVISFWGISLVICLKSYQLASGLSSPSIMISSVISGRDESLTREVRITLMFWHDSKTRRTRFLKLILSY